jgi:hypothetical protein
LRLLSGVVTTRANLGHRGPSRPLFCAVLGTAASAIVGVVPPAVTRRTISGTLEWVRAFIKEALGDLIWDPPPPKLVEQRTIPPLPRAITRLNECSGEAFVVDEADRCKAIYCGKNKLRGVARGD